MRANLLQINLDQTKSSPIKPNQAKAEVRPTRPSGFRTTARGWRQWLPPDNICFTQEKVFATITAGRAAKNMETRLRILLLEDSASDAELILSELRRGGIEHVCHCVAIKKGFLEALWEFRPELILADFNLPGFSGVEALAISRGQCPDVPVIMVTGSLGEEVAVETLK